MKNYTLEDILRFREAGMTWREIGGNFAEEGEDAYLVGERIRSHYRRFKKRGLKRQTVHIGQTENTVSSSCSTVSILSSEELLKAHGYDPTLWEIVDSSTALNAHGGSTSRIKVKPKAQVLPVEKIREMFNDIAPVYIKKNRQPNSLMRRGTLVVPLFDMHYGRWAFGLNDTPIKYFEDAVVYKVRTLSKQYGKVVFLIGQDMFNSDSIRNTTTLGTKLDPSDRFENAYKEGYGFICRLLKMALEEFEEVTTCYTYGNHDRTLGYAMAVGLSHMFPEVKSIISKTARTYLQLDRVLVGVTHGDGLVNINGVMANEANEMWGNTCEHIWIIGHKHTFRVEEKEGMTIYGVPSPCVTDDWHDNKGYQSAQRMVMLGVGSQSVEAIYIC